MCASDIVHAFAGVAWPTAPASERGLVATEPAEFVYGWDLSGAEGKRR